MGELVRYEIDRAVATVTLDSPANRNALSAQLVTELSDHLTSAGADESVRAIVLTHTGTVFCAGADLKEQASEGGPEQGTKRMLALLRAIVELSKPVVARVDGAVRAGGLGLVGACDIAIASQQASFAFTEVRLGLAPAIISLTTLDRMTERAASRYFLTGETFDAVAAASAGLTDRRRRRPRRRAGGGVRRVALLLSARPCRDQAAHDAQCAGRLHRARRRGAGAVRTAVRLGGSAGRDARLPAETPASVDTAVTTLEAREPQQDRSRATRARLLESAITCLADLGWSASTVAVVAEHAGVSRGAAQHHFPTREALFMAALEHVTRERGEQLRQHLAQRPASAPRDTRAIVDLVFELFTGTYFRAALMLWVAAAAEPQLREQIVPLEARIGRQVHRMVVDLLGVDEHVPGVRETVQATLDLARGLGLANLLTDDSRRRERIARRWAATLDATLR